MPIPEQVRNRKFYFTADELSDEARQYFAKMPTVRLQSEYDDAPDRSGAVCPTVEDKTWLDLQLSEEKEHGIGVTRMLQSLGVDPTEHIKEAEGPVTAGSRKLDYFRMRMEDWVERTLTRVLAQRTGAIQMVFDLPPARLAEYVGRYGVSVDVPGGGSREQMVEVTAEGGRLRVATLAGEPSDTPDVGGLEPSRLFSRLAFFREDAALVTTGDPTVLGADCVRDSSGRDAWIHWGARLVPRLA